MCDLSGFLQKEAHKFKTFVVRYTSDLEIHKWQTHETQSTGEN